MADLTKSRVDLIRRAATELGKLVSGQDIEAEDNDTIDGLVDPLLRQLSFDGIITIDPDAIESEYFLPLARLLANESAPSFGTPKSPDIQAMEERTLRRLTASKPTYETLKVSYF